MSDKIQRLQPYNCDMTYDVLDAEYGCQLPEGTVLIRESDFLSREQELLARVERLEWGLKNAVNLIPIEDIRETLESILNETLAQSVNAIKEQAIREHCGNAFLIPPYTANKIKAEGIRESANALYAKGRGVAKDCDWLVEYADKLEQGE